jgi:hypothetical protein
VELAAGAAQQGVVDRDQQRRMAGSSPTAKPATTSPTWSADQRADAKNRYARS